MLALGVVFVWGDVASAQPGRQMPGSRQPIGTSPPRTFPDPNSRVRPSANQIGFQSADVYAKPGYPKFLGDAVETGSQTGGSTAITGGAAGAAGNAGSVNGGGFQGNIGNQIGSNTGGTILGGLFGLRPGEGPMARGSGFSGGGLSGIVPKGFGFGGTPEITSSSLNPLGGGFAR
jgi:hypothetical protein